MVLTLYGWLLRLYPRSYRDKFGEEMTSVFREARIELPPALPATISFYRREFCGLLSGALGAQWDCLLGPSIRFRRFDMQPQFRFPRSTVLLMLVIFAGVLLAIRQASMVAGDTSGSVWPVVSVLAFMLLTMCTAAAVVWGILHSLRRSGRHRLENLHGCMHSVESNGKS